MAKSDSHIKQWMHNRAFLQTIDPAYPDWQVTACFYAALQAVDALLAHDGEHVDGHQRRNALLCEANRYRAIWLKYQPLYGLARSVRYMADPASWVPAAEIEPRVVKRMLYPIEASVQKLMKRDLSLDAVTLCTAAA